MEQLSSLFLETWLSSLLSLRGVASGDRVDNLVCCGPAVHMHMHIPGVILDAG
jgi:hypothetical protein